jgi:hypothetical protein
MTSSPPARTAAMLSLLRPIADEVVIAADDRLPAESLGPLTALADRVVRFPYEPPPDRANAWLLSLCGGDWIFRIDDDEVPSAALLRAIPGLTRDERVTHCQVPRLWLWPDADSTIARWPWRPDYQPRLMRNRPELLDTPGLMHTQTTVSGPGRHLSEPLYHLNCIVRDRATRERNAKAYERYRPGVRIAGQAVNPALYLPERTSPPTEAVPAEDRGLIALALDERAAAGGSAAARLGARAAAAGGGGTPAPGNGGGVAVEGGGNGGAHARDGGHAPVEQATRTDIDFLWRSAPPSPTRVPEEADFAAGVRVAESSLVLRAGEHRTVAARIENSGGFTWPAGPVARPAIRVCARWRRADGSAVGDGDPAPFDLPVAPGEAVEFAVPLTAPDVPGLYLLDVQVVHELVRRVDGGGRIPVTVEPQPRLAIAGPFGALPRTGPDSALTAELRALATEVPEVEPLVLVADPVATERRIGYRCGTGAHAFLVDDLPRAGAARTVALLSRARRLERAARALATGGEAHVPRPARQLLAGLRRAGALLVLAEPHEGDDRGDAITAYASVAAARALGLPVVVAGVGREVFARRAELPVVLRALRRATAVEARDVFTARALRLAGVRAVVSPPSGAALPPAPAPDADAVLRGAGLPPDRDFAVVALHADGGLPASLDALAAALDRLADAHGLEALALPMDPHGEPSDLWPLLELRKRMRAPERLHLPDPAPAAEVAAAVVARARLALGGRAHLHDLAAAHGVPALDPPADAGRAIAAAEELLRSGPAGPSRRPAPELAGTGLARRLAAAG